MTTQTSAIRYVEASAASADEHPGHRKRPRSAAVSMMTRTLAIDDIPLQVLPNGGRAVAEEPVFLDPYRRRLGQVRACLAAMLVLALAFMCLAAVGLR